MLKKEEFELLLFEKSLKTNVSNNLYLLNDSLVRIDATKIVILNLKENTKRECVYQLTEIDELSDIENLEILANGNLEIRTENEVIKLDNKKGDETIKEVKEIIGNYKKGIPFSFKINSDELNRHLLVLENQSDEENETIYINVDGSIGITKKNINRELNLEVLSSENQLEVCLFSFDDFNSIFDSANIDQEIIFEIFGSKYSIIKINGNLELILTLKKA